MFVGLAAFAGLVRLIGLFAFLRFVGVFALAFAGELSRRELAVGVLVFFSESGGDFGGVFGLGGEFFLREEAVAVFVLFLEDRLRVLLGFGCSAGGLLGLQRQREGDTDGDEDEVFHWIRGVVLVGLVGFPVRDHE